MGSFFFIVASSGVSFIYANAFITSTLTVSDCHSMFGSPFQTNYAVVGLSLLIWFSPWRSLSTRSECSLVLFSMKSLLLPNWRQKPNCKQPYPIGNDLVGVKLLALNLYFRNHHHVWLFNSLPPLHLFSTSYIRGFRHSSPCAVKSSHPPPKKNPLSKTTAMRMESKVRM